MNQTRPDTQGPRRRIRSFVRREGLRLLKEEWGSTEEAVAGIFEGLEAFYRESYPSVAAEMAGEIATAGEVVGDLWATNVFPQMNVTWGTYPDHIGHAGFKSGCLRCHTSSMTTEDGEAVSTDCSNCHQLLAMDRPAAEIRLTTEDAD